MPDVLVKHQRGLFPEEKKLSFAVLTQIVVAETLNVPGTAAELNADEVKVDFATFDSGAATNGYGCVIKVGTNLYPERAGREREYSDRIAAELRPHLPSGYRCCVWVRLALGGFTEFHT